MFTYSLKKILVNRNESPDGQVLSLTKKEYGSSVYRFRSS